MIIKNQNYLIIFKSWLIVLICLIFIMIIVGGLTRLTNSGLSITEWELFSGIFPPFLDSTWEYYFSLYRSIPQFKLLNPEMNIDHFKIIFYWEYFHRLLGRLIGLIFLLPLIFFIIKKVITIKHSINLCFIFFLICLQGIIGWYMVKSGLTNNVTVSHYRLAIHLTLAFIIMSLLYWNYLNLNNNNYKSFFLINVRNIMFRILIVLILIQIIFGAFVSGLDAGKIYQTWPMMNSTYFPDDTNYKNLLSLLDFNNKGLVQFLHRNIAYFILLYIILVGFIIYKKNIIQVKRSYFYVLYFLSFQIILGIFTLISSLNIFVALAHQITSLLLYLSIVHLNYAFAK